MYAALKHVAEDNSIKLDVIGLIGHEHSRRE